MLEKKRRNKESQRYPLDSLRTTLTEVRLALLGSEVKLPQGEPLQRGCGIEEDGRKEEQKARHEKKVCTRD